MSDKNLDQEKMEEFENKLLPVLIETLEEDLKEEDLITDTQKQKKKANEIILGFVTAAGATGALPIPFADTPLLIAQQTAMLLKLTDSYGINLKKNALRSLAFTVLGISGTTVLGKTITGSLMKLLPGAGSVAGAAVNGSTAALLTYALGKAYCEMCESVLAGDLSEQEMLEHKGRLMLETAFKDYMRLGFTPSEKEDDVLKTRSVPSDDEPIELPSAKSSDEEVPARMDEEDEGTVSLQEDAEHPEGQDDEKAADESSKSSEN